MQTVTAASVGADGSLVLQLDRLGLTVRGSEADFTTQACWWIGTGL